MDLRIKEIMQEKKITSAWLAEKTGISKVSISNAITGKFLPSLENTIKIASALGVSISELLGEDEDKNINGYIELNGTIHKVTSKEDIKKLAEEL